MAHLFYINFVVTILLVLNINTIILVSLRLENSWSISWISGDELITVSVLLKLLRKHESKYVKLLLLVLGLKLGQLFFGPLKLMAEPEFLEINYHYSDNLITYL